MAIIRDDDEERLARVERMLEVVKKRREEVSETSESERISDDAAATCEAARTASRRPDEKET
jgi:hypothetical protein